MPQLPASRLTTRDKSCHGSLAMSPLMPIWRTMKVSDQDTVSPSPSPYPSSSSSPHLIQAPSPLPRPKKFHLNSPTTPPAMEDKSDPTSTSRPDLRTLWEASEHSKSLSLDEWPRLPGPGSDSRSILPEDRMPYRYRRPGSCKIHLLTVVLQRSWMMTWKPRSTTMDLRYRTKMLMHRSKRVPGC